MRRRLRQLNYYYIGGSGESPGKPAAKHAWQEVMDAISQTERIAKASRIMQENRADDGIIFLSPLLFDNKRRLLSAETRSVAFAMPLLSILSMSISCLSKPRQFELPFKTRVYIHASHGVESLRGIQHRKSAPIDVWSPQALETLVAGCFRWG